MNRMMPFDNPLLLGFDHVEHMLDRMATASDDGYPPYDIVTTGEADYRITLSVAGFSHDELAISLDDRQLTIRGKQGEPADDAVFLHHGIAARQFQRSFLLADGLDVVGAWLDAGLLHVDLVRPKPETQNRIIEIKDNSA